MTNATAGDPARGTLAEGGPAGASPVLPPAPVLPDPTLQDDVDLDAEDAFGHAVPLGERATLVVTVPEPDDDDIDA